MPPTFRKWGDIIPLVLTGGATLSDTYRVAEDCYLYHAEVEVVGYAARVNLAVEETKGNYVELVDRGTVPSSEVTYDGCYPLRAGQEIRVQARTDTTTTGRLILMFCDQQILPANVRDQRRLEHGVIEFESFTNTSTGAGALEASSDLDQHQVRYIQQPIQAYQKSGGAKDIRIYLTDGTTDILIHTEAGAADNTWTTLDITTIDFPYIISKGWDIMAQQTAAGAAEEVGIRFPARRVAN